jgi:hypothetical protein
MLTYLWKEKMRLHFGRQIRNKNISQILLLVLRPVRLYQSVQERLTPHPYSNYEDPPPTPDDPAQSASIPRTYIHCTLGPLSSWMQPFAARARRLKWDVYTINLSHDVMITHPNELAEILLQIANRLHVFRNQNSIM